MSKYAGNAARLWLFHYDMSSVLSSIALDVTQETPDVTCFSDAGPRAAVGNYGYKFSRGGFFTNDQFFDSQAFSRMTGGIADSSTANYLSYLPEGDTEGKVSYDLMLNSVNYSVPAKVGGVVAASVDGVGRAGASRGQILRNATLTGNSSGTGRNLGVTTTGQEFRVIIRTFSGTWTSFDIRIDQSDDDGAVDPYTFTDATLEQTSIDTATTYVISTTTATKAWKRARVLNFVGTDCVLGVTAGVIKGTPA